MGKAYYQPYTVTGPSYPAKHRPHKPTHYSGCFRLSEYTALEMVCISVAWHPVQ